MVKSALFLENQAIRLIGSSTVIYMKDSKYLEVYD